MLTLLFTMFSNYCSQGPQEPPGGDTREVAPKPPVRPSALSLVINKINTRFHPGGESGQIIPKTRDSAGHTWLLQICKRWLAPAGPPQGQSGVQGALHQRLQALHTSPGKREPAARLPRNPTRGPLGLLKPDFPAKLIPSDFYEQAPLK